VIDTGVTAPVPKASATAQGAEASLRCGRYRLSLTKPLVMGIVNLAPDSFSGDGRACTDAALHYAEAQLSAGADLLDLGAESTRPGSVGISADEELQRLMPLLERLSGCGVPISVDTCKAAVMREALAAGADMINDIMALRMPGALENVRDTDCAVCLMHMQGRPATMQIKPTYEDVSREVGNFLADRKHACIDAGIDAERLLLDPGFGFGKTLQHNLALFRALPQLSALGRLLVGVSRKSLVGQLTGRGIAERLPGSVAASLLAAQAGAKVLRVHDVGATCDALAVWQGVDGTSGQVIH